MFRLSQLIRPTDYNGQPIRFIQQKENGIRLVVMKGAGVPKLLTREGKTNFWAQICAVEHLRTQVESLPRFTAVDCEVSILGVAPTEIKTALANGDERLRLAAFALPWFDCQDWRLARWRLAEARLIELGWPTVQTISNSADLRTPDQQEIERLLGLARASGSEGWVLKQAHYAGWYKLKPVRTCDCVVLGYSLSDSATHFGGLKALKVGLEGVEVASVGSGFTSEYRMSVDPETLVGKVCEVEYDSIAGQGKLNFPRFLRWRDDKAAHECRMEQIR